MTILPSDFVAKFLTVHALPGSVFFHVQDFKLKNGSDASLVLSAIKRDAGLTDPAYIFMIRVNECWHACPFIGDDMHQRMLTQAIPSDLLNLIPPDLMEVIAQKPSIEQVVRDTTALREQSEKVAELRDKLLDLSEQDAKTNG